MQSYFTRIVHSDRHTSLRQHATRTASTHLISNNTNDFFSSLSKTMCIISYPSLPISPPGNAHQGQLPFHLIETCNPPTIDSSPPPFFLPSSFFLQGEAGHTHSPSLPLLSYCSSLLAFLAGESKTFFLLSLLTDCKPTSAAHLPPSAWAWGLISLPLVSLQGWDPIQVSNTDTHSLTHLSPS